VASTLTAILPFVAQAFLLAAVRREPFGATHPAVRMRRPFG